MRQPQVRSEAGHMLKSPHEAAILRECVWMSLIEEMQADMCASDKSKKERD